MTLLCGLCVCSAGSHSVCFWDQPWWLEMKLAGASPPSSVERPTCHGEFLFHSLHHDQDGQP